MAIVLEEKFAGFGEHWAPKVVAQLNGLHVKAVKIQGEFVWHAHPNTDELFFVHKGCVNIQYRDRDNLVRAGEMFVVPRGVEHRPVAEQECEMVLIEPPERPTPATRAGR
jgi:mannose-6-phosphate isomerase-like protein (cupin superfamily)